MTHEWCSSLAVFKLYKHNFNVTVYKYMLTVKSFCICTLLIICIHRRSDRHDHVHSRTVNHYICPLQFVHLGMDRDRSSILQSFFLDIS